MKIRAFFLTCMAVIAVITLALAATVASYEWRRLSDKRAGIAAAESFQATLKLIEMLTLERSPTNSVLTAEQASDPETAKRLADARANADAAVKTLAAILPADQKGRIDALTRAMAEARVGVDADAAKPRAQRPADVVVIHTRKLLALATHYDPILGQVSQAVTAADPQLAMLTLLAGYAVELREFAGRKASTVAPANSASRPLTPQEILAADQFEGRITQLRRDIEQTIAKLGDKPALAQAFEVVKKEYFTEGAGLTAAVLDIGRKSGNYGEAGTKFSESIVAKLQTILGLRDAALKVALAEADSEKVKAETNLMFALGAIVLVVLVIGGVAVLFSRRVVSPLVTITGRVGDLASGRRDIEIPYRERTDEIGAMAQAVEVFRQNAIAAERVQQEAAEGRLREAELKREQEDRERAAADERRANEEKARLAEVERQREAAEATRRAEAERQAEAERLRQEAENRRKAELHDLASSFQSAVGGVVDAVASAATEMQATATSMTGIADRTARQSLAASSATEQAAANVQTVASASEELSASIREIASQVANSSRIASSAVEQAQRTDAIVQGLASSAEKIGEVVGLINQIAGQTNLLALNATIEAARAGEAGKGFAVVASEVKNLATQTSKATDEIGQQIGSVQTATQSAVAAIREIGGVIGQINEIASAIAAAVEQQGAATNEIARNVEQAANGTKEASANVTEVNQSAREAGSAAGQVLDASGELSRQAEQLRTEVGRFLDRIRAS
jgi:methyl-accepting chemotaxis protein